METNLIQRKFKDLKISEQAFAVGLRYSKLIDEFKELVDKENIRLCSAVDISFMTEKQQRLAYSVMVKLNVIDMKTAKQLREISSSYAVVSEELIMEALTGEYGKEGTEPKDKGEKITLTAATYKRYLSSYSKKEENEIIEKALGLYFEQVNV